MARTFAGALGLIAWIITLVHGWLSGGGIAEILSRGWMCLFVFTALGLAAGHVAGWIIDDSVRSRVALELAAAETSRQKVTDGS